MSLRVSKVSLLSDALNHSFYNLKSKIVLPNSNRKDKLMHVIYHLWNLKVMKKESSSSLKRNVLSAAFELFSMFLVY